MNQNAEVIMFALANDNPVELLDIWMHGDFDTIREQWPEFPTHLLTHDENESLLMLRQECILKDQTILNLAGCLRQLRDAIEPSHDKYDMIQEMCDVVLATENLL